MCRRTEEEEGHCPPRAPPGSRGGGGGGGRGGRVQPREPLPGESPGETFALSFPPLVAFASSPQRSQLSVRIQGTPETAPGAGGEFLTAVRGAADAGVTAEGPGIVSANLSVCVGVFSGHALSVCGCPKLSFQH